eukprot:5499333-Amphidinium_carterae.2
MPSGGGTTASAMPGTRARVLLLDCLEFPLQEQMGRASCVSLRRMGATRLKAYPVSFYSLPDVKPLTEVAVIWTPLRATGRIGGTRVVERFHVAHSMRPLPAVLLHSCAWKNWRASWITIDWLG